MIGVASHLCTSGLLVEQLFYEPRTSGYLKARRAEIYSPVAAAFAFHVDCSIFELEPCLFHIRLVLRIPTACGSFTVRRESRCSTIME